MALLKSRIKNPSAYPKIQNTPRRKALPELPDVETYRRYLAAKVLHKRIADVEIKDRLILRSPERSIRSIRGKHFTDTARHGKHCFLELTGGGFLALHFGMTGGVEYRESGMASSEHVRLIISFSGGGRLAFFDMRRLGRVRLVKSMQDFVTKNGLGPDALSVGRKEFESIIRSWKGMIKALLMNQRQIAGLGNIYCDEILYHSGTNPRKRTSKLESSEIDRIYNSMKNVLKIAIQKKADPSRMPANYLLRRRMKGASCRLDDGKIERVKVGGRSTYYCMRHQK